ncbi:MAG: hypothetical protein JNM84_20300 [Planctomycetes bacterium]|nr:hypothetical protein [Planctomycetota bacterium]
MLSRWVVRGEVQRFGIGIARVDAPRELELDVEEENAPSGSRRWRARVISVRRSQSIVLGRKELLDVRGEAARSAAPFGDGIEGLAGQQLRVRSEGAGRLSRANELPRLEVPSEELEARLLSSFDLRVLPCPEHAAIGERAPEQSAIWRLPAAGGTLELRWRSSALPPTNPARLRLAAPVEAAWWREGTAREGPPTRRGRGTATWELDLERRRFLAFELVLEGLLEPDLGAEPEVHVNANLTIELRWEPFDRYGLVGRDVSRAFLEATLRYARAASEVLARVLR